MTTSPAPVRAVANAVSQWIDAYPSTAIDILFGGFVIAGGPILLGRVISSRSRLNAALHEKAERLRRDRATELLVQNYRGADTVGGSVAVADETLRRTGYQGGFEAEPAYAITRSTQQQDRQHTHTACADSLHNLPSAENDQQVRADGRDDGHVGAEGAGPRNPCPVLDGRCRDCKGRVQRMQHRVERPWAGLVREEGRHAGILSSVDVECGRTGGQREGRAEEACPSCFRERASGSGRVKLG